MSPSRTAVGKRRPAPKSRTVLDRPPPQRGWKTTDADEIALRRWRGATEIVTIEALEPDAENFGTFRVRSGTGSSYEVEIAALWTMPIPAAASIIVSTGWAPASISKACWRQSKGRAARRFANATKQGSPRIEVFLDRRDSAAPRVAFPASGSLQAGSSRPNLRLSGDELVLGFLHLSGRDDFLLVQAALPFVRSFREVSSCLGGCQLSSGLGQFAALQYRQRLAAPYVLPFDRAQRDHARGQGGADFRIRVLIHAQLAEQT